MARGLSFDMSERLRRSATRTRMGSACSPRSVRPFWRPKPHDADQGPRDGDFDDEEQQHCTSSPCRGLSPGALRVMSPEPAGVESMSQIPMGGDRPSPNPGLMTSRPQAYTPMGTTSENVASRYGVSREDQDAFAASSHQKAAAAIAAGRFSEEIVPVQTRVYEGGTWREVTVEQDDGVRADTTAEGLSKLKPAFAAKGTTTAGNSSQMSDGASATVLMSRQRAEALGIPAMGVLRSFQVVGVDPEVMGIGPAVAIPKALQAAGLSLDEIDLFEINEAFASQAVYCVRELGIDPAKVNVNGGAIALGHPLGCTGAKLTATLLHEMKRRGSRYGVVSMCIGGGMGAAAVFEREAG